RISSASPSQPLKTTYAAGARSAAATSRRRMRALGLPRTTTAVRFIPTGYKPDSATLREDVAVGWEALDQWGDDVARIEPLTGGVGGHGVWSGRVNGPLAVGRLGKRSDADLSWETELLRHLDREGMTVPVPIPTRDG